MKLNKTEIQALARQIRRQALDKCNSEQELAMLSPEVIEMAKISVNLFQQLPPGVFKEYYTRD